MSHQSLLYLPIEVAKREFDAKLYLGMHACKRGYASLLGWHLDDIFSGAPPGFYLYKDHAPHSDERIRALRSRGFIIGALDEEGLIYATDAIYVRARVSASLASLYHSVFFWGETQASLIRHHALDVGGHIVGNPRFDLARLWARQRHMTLSSKPRQRVLRVLINTRFASINGVRGTAEIENLRNLGVLTTSTEEENFRIFQGLDQRLFEEFKKLILALNDEPWVQVTIRPHPMEVASAYQALIPGSKNIAVDGETDLLAQLSSHDLVVHDGCTTAIEAAATGTPVLGLRPQEVSYSYGHVANAFSDQSFPSWQLLIAALRQWDDFVPKPSTADPTTLASKKDLLARQLIHNWSSRASATELILDEIDSYSLPSYSVAKLFRNRPSRRYTWRDRLFHQCRDGSLIGRVTTAIFPDRTRDFVIARSTRDHKFPTLSQGILDDRLNKLAALDPALKGLRFRTTLVSPRSFLLLSSS